MNIKFYTYEDAEELYKDQNSYIYGYHNDKEIKVEIAGYLYNKDYYLQQITREAYKQEIARIEREYLLKKCSVDLEYPKSDVNAS